MYRTTSHSLKIGDKFHNLRLLFKPIKKDKFLLTVVMESGTFGLLSQYLPRIVSKGCVKIS